MARYVRALLHAPLLLLGIAVTFFIVPSIASAGMLTFVSDTINTSAPSATTTSHVIRFTASTTIPAGGKINVVFEPNGASYNVPSGLDYTDVDLAVGTSTLVDRTLSATPSATDDGVSLVSGANGSLTITLGSGASSPIPAGSSVRLTIGLSATVGAVGDVGVENPGAVGSYHVRLSTTDASNAGLDYGSTLIAIVSPVTLGRVDTTDAVPPTISNALPSGLLPGGTAYVFISFNTDKLATCRYDTASGTPYASMLASTTFTTANLGTLHFSTVAVASSTIYNYFVRCANNSGVVNTSDHLISFEIGVIPGTTTPPAPPPPPPTPSGGSSGSGGGGGAGGPFLGKGDVTIEGRGVPGAMLTILKDGTIAREVQISFQGEFSERFTDLDRGTYTWGVYLTDADKRLSSRYTSTIYLISRTNNLIAPVLMSPTISTGSSTLPVGNKLTVSGYAIPLTPVQVIMNKQGNVITAEIISASTTANGNGTWTLSLPTEKAVKGTYEIKAVSVFSNGKDRSLISPILYIGIGEDPNPNFGLRSDLNKDKKVNLVDFSILLFNWRTTDAVADINQDGTVNLTDFSIMLANWTG